jgi:hypothetical protein
VPPLRPPHCAINDQVEVTEIGLGDHPAQIIRVILHRRSAVAHRPTFRPSGNVGQSFLAGEIAFDLIFPPLSGNFKPSRQRTLIPLSRPGYGKRKSPPRGGIIKPHQIGNGRRRNHPKEPTAAPAAQKPAARPVPTYRRINGYLSRSESTVYPAAAPIPEPRPGPDQSQRPGQFFIYRPRTVGAKKSAKSFLLKKPG